MTTDVFFYEAFEEEQAELRRHMPDLNAGYDWRTVQEADHTEPPAPIISVRTQSIIPVAWAPKLTGILSRSTGFDHLERYIADARRPIPCGYLPLYCARAVAEQAMLMWMALLRKLPQQRSSFGTFSRDGLTGSECAERNLLVVGVGNIGYEIIKIGRGLEMAVTGVDIDHWRDDVTYADFATSLPSADIIVCAMNLTSDNAGYFNRETLANAKPGAVFINISRGELSPTAELLHLLDTGVLGGVGLDVFDGEADLAVTLRTGAASSDPRVLAVQQAAPRDDVILTPHNAFNTWQAIVRKSEHSAQQVAHMLQHGGWLWPIPHA